MVPGNVRPIGVFGSGDGETRSQSVCFGLAGVSGWRAGHFLSAALWPVFDYLFGWLFGVQECCSISIFY